MGAFFRPQPITLFNDLDGVHVGWTEAVYALYGKTVPETAIDYEVYDDLGVPEDEVWARINSYGPEWWANLPAYSWSRDLWSRLEALGYDMSICTSPCTIGNSAKGKTEWIRKHIAPTWRDYVITPKKYRVANPRAVLIDDSDKKIEEFREYGGIGIVFPRPWNSGGYCKPEEIVDRVVSNVRDAILRAGLKV